MPKYWIGVAGRDHVRDAVRGGFCQFNHGKMAPVQRLQRGDRVVYYSPRTRMTGGEPLQAFTAAGEISDDAPARKEQSSEFHPFRRRTDYADVNEAPIRPLLPSLSFTRGTAHWGLALRRGLFEISLADYRTIVHAMGLPSA